MVRSYFQKGFFSIYFWSKSELLNQLSRESKQIWIKQAIPCPLFPCSPQIPLLHHTPPISLYFLFLCPSYSSQKCAPSTVCPTGDFRCPRSTSHQTPALTSLPGRRGLERKQNPGGWEEDAPEPMQPLAMLDKWRGVESRLTNTPSTLCRSARLPPGHREGMGHQCHTRAAPISGGGFGPFWFSQSPYMYSLKT